MNNQNMIDTVTRISGVNPRKCMRCGKCSASCPAYDEMEYHPHQFLSLIHIWEGFQERYPFTNPKRTHI